MSSILYGKWVICKSTMMRLFLLLFIFFVCPAHAEFIQLGSRGAGMFSIFTNVLWLCDDYEKGAISGFEVRFGRRGAYFDQAMGQNWWEYYCEPLSCGNKDGAE